MTYYEAIKCMNEDAFARFIMMLELGVCTIPKKYDCNEVYCINCKDQLSCYKKYINQEVKEV